MPSKPKPRAGPRPIRIDPCLDRHSPDYNKALEINPRLAIAYYNRGNAYLSKGQYDEAISDYNKALEINPRYAGAYANRGFFYYAKGQYDKAWEDMHKAEDLGLKTPLKYLNELRKASGRQK